MWAMGLLSLSHTKNRPNRHIMQGLLGFLDRFQNSNCMHLFQFIQPWIICVYRENVLKYSTSGYIGFFYLYFFMYLRRQVTLSFSQDKYFNLEK